MLLNLLLTIGLFALFSYSVSGVCAMFLFKNKKRDFLSFGTLLFFTLIMFIGMVKVAEMIVG